MLINAVGALVLEPCAAIWIIGLRNCAGLEACQHLFIGMRARIDTRGWARYHRRRAIQVTAAETSA